jgi:flagellar P-ring protein precursor FlgI
MRLYTSIAILAAAVLPLGAAQAFFSDATGHGSRLKEVATIEGVRDNQLVGYGLVVGLKGTGDRQQTVFAVQSLTNLLQRMGVAVDPTKVTVKNTAAVMVTANLPPFADQGAKIDVTVSSIGDASNLQGGSLILTSLKGADGQVYAVAQGSVVTGGFAEARNGSSQTLNHPTAGRIPEGATVERDAPRADLSKRIKLQLHSTDFTTASRVAATLNKKFAEPDQPVANAESGRIVSVAIPARYAGRPIDFVADMENLTVQRTPPRA